MVGLHPSDNSDNDRSITASIHYKLALHSTKIEVHNSHTMSRSHISMDGSIEPTAMKLPAKRKKNI